MKKIKIGHIGWTFKDHGDDCETVAWCDINEEKMKKAAEAHPDITMYTDYKEMAKHPGLDAVVISTPNWVHAEQAIHFMENGIDVFLEKPMGITKDETDQILQTSANTGRICVIDFEMRVCIFAERIKAIIDSGEYGELKHIEFVHHRGCWHEEGNGIWRTRTEKSGGMFFMEPIHEVDIFRFFGGEINSVQCVAAPTVLPQYQFQDNLCSHFFFDTGALGTILTSHTHSAYTSDPEKWAELGHDMTMIFTCTKGSIGVDMIHAKILINKYVEYPEGSGGYRVEFDRLEDYSEDGHSRFAHDITRMRKEFIRRLANDEPQVHDVLSAWKSHQVCVAAEESRLKDGQRITVDYALPDGV